jgi:FkbM family methyltransferase
MNKLKELFRYFRESKFLNRSYSQEGEDMILSRFLNKRNGFFVDVGAHHPIRFSNTFKFYNSGWRGINIDAMPGSMEVFKKIRQQDINLEIPISDVDEKIKYYIFNETALNSLNEEEARKKAEIPGYFIKEIVELQTQRLDNVLAKYLPYNQKIDFMSVDVEGLDIQVLKSNDWVKFRPEYLLVEELELSIENILTESEVYAFMKNCNYILVARSYNTSFYKTIF